MEQGRGGTRATCHNQLFRYEHDTYRHRDTPHAIDRLTHLRSDIVIHDSCMLCTTGRPPRQPVSGVLGRYYSYIEGS
jgi:hypothetical protein